MSKPTIFNISLLLAQNKREIERFVNYFSNRIYNVAYSFVGSKEDAEEITQDVFIACFNSLKSFQQRSSLETWIYRITINK